MTPKKNNIDKKGNQKSSGSERRRHPRLTGNIPVKICSDEFDIVTETRNLSCTGAYCRIIKYIEPMTKLKIQLLLPFKSNNKITTKKVSCNGVIVRTQAASDNASFDVAIYFNEIKDRDAECISDFVSGKLGINADQFH